MPNIGNNCMCEHKSTAELLLKLGATPLTAPAAQCSAVVIANPNP